MLAKKPRHNLVIKDYEFNLSTLTVKKGDLVEISLDDSSPLHAEHTIDIIYLGRNKPSVYFEGPLMTRGGIAKFDVKMTLAGELIASCKLYPDVICNISVHDDTDLSNSDSQVNYISQRNFIPSGLAELVHYESHRGFNPFEYSSDSDASDSDVEKTAKPVVQRGHGKEKFNASIIVKTEYSDDKVESSRSDLIWNNLTVPSKNGIMSDDSDSFLESDEISESTDDSEEEIWTRSKFASVPEKSKSFTASSTAGLISNLRIDPFIDSNNFQKAKSTTSVDKKGRIGDCPVNSSSIVKSTMTHGDHSVYVEEFRFQPSQLTISQGDSVCFIAKNVNSAISISCDGIFSESVSLYSKTSKEKSYCHTFDTPGDFVVVNDIFSFGTCQLHVDPKRPLASSSRTSPIILRGSFPFTIPYQVSSNLSSPNSKKSNPIKASPTSGKVVESDDSFSDDSEDEFIRPPRLTQPKSIEKKDSIVTQLPRLHGSFPIVSTRSESSEEDNKASLYRKDIPSKTEDSNELKFKTNEDLSTAPKKLTANQKKRLKLKLKKQQVNSAMLQSNSSSSFRMHLVNESTNNMIPINDSCNKPDLIPLNEKILPTVQTGMCDSTESVDFKRIDECCESQDLISRTTDKTFFRNNETFAPPKLEVQTPNKENIEPSSLVVSPTAKDIHDDIVSQGANMKSSTHAMGKAQQLWAILKKESPMKQKSSSITTSEQFPSSSSSGGFINETGESIAKKLFKSNDLYFPMNKIIQEEENFLAERWSNLENLIQSKSKDKWAWNQREVDIVILTGTSNSLLECNKTVHIEDRTKRVRDIDCMLSLGKQIYKPPALRK